MLLTDWAGSHDGYRVGLLADPHVRDRETVSLTRRALEYLVRESPDMIAFAGDMVSYWKSGVEEMLREALEPLKGYSGDCIAVLGNHDYYGGDPERLRPLLEEFGVRLLVNECWNVGGVDWVGVDSATEGEADPYGTILKCDPTTPTIVLWHEPDFVDVLPKGPDLMLAGHSHGGQFTTPWGWAPMTSRHGKKYLRGFYTGSPVPIYVSRGLGTTGPPARLFCSPEVTVLTLCRKP
ncbi:MAG TPA: metallophosphoesterase [Fimbriimonadaceae bacterium]|nr:metallophosphoesterase [Fimbriimonadaceae bacterium]